MMMDDESRWKRLDHPIETLGLPDDVVSKLKETGITAIIHCVNVFYPSPFDNIEIEHPYAAELKDTVRSKLEEQGLQPVSPYPEAWLYISIDELGLFASATRMLKRTGITSVADCIGAFCEPQPDTMGVVYPPYGFRIHGIISRHVKEKLEAHGYWPLAE